MLGASKVRPRDTLADVSRELKFNVQKRLLETLDVTKLDGMDSALAAEKVTTAISSLLDEQAVCLPKTIALV